MNFEKFWTLYIKAFPKDERRTLEQQQEILNEPLYNLDMIYKEGESIGFIAMWDLHNLLFVEHIAIDDKFRGRGIGAKIIKELIDKNNKKIVLEVERPETEIAIRRIKFYEKLGFKLNMYNYYQPAYNKERNSVPLYIMTYPNSIDQKEYKDIKEKIYKTVYKV